MDLDYISTRRLSRFYDKLKDWLSLNYSTKVELAEATQDMRGATEQFAGAHGLVPTPDAADRNKFLKGDATWAAVPDVQASTSGVGGTDGLMLATDKERLDSFREVSNSEVDNIFGAFIGGRDYRTVIIGNQMWLAENLDWKFDGLQIGGVYTESVANAWYYDNDEDTYGVNGNKYGLMYNGPALFALNGGLLTGGWRVPSLVDYRTLVANVSTTGTGSSGNNAGLKLKVSSAGGTDDYGFSMYMNGLYNNGYFGSVDTWGGFGLLNNTAFQYVSTGSSYDYLNTTGMNFGGALCIRLVKDIT